MATRIAATFTKAILLVLLTSACPSLQQNNNYNPVGFSDWSNLRQCVQNCLGGYYHPLTDLGCSTNQCYCRADVIPQAVSAVSYCASVDCSNTNDVVAATSFYEAYCSSGTPTPISLIKTSPPTAVPGSVVTGTISKLCLT